eukprot:COSAG02_NODE_19600_length_873_cov_5.466408_1_plen_200_part_00
MAWRGSCEPCGPATTPERPWPHLQRIAQKCDCKLPWCDAGWYQHEHGQLRFAVPAENEQLARIWLAKMGYDSTESDAAWQAISKRVKSNREKLYCSIIHFYDCDFTVSKGASRTTAWLHAETAHVDSLNGKQVKADRAFKSPYPSRPQRGALLGDGFIFQYTYHPGVIFRRVHGPGVIFRYSATPGVIFGQKGTLCDNF